MSSLQQKQSLAITLSSILISLPLVYSQGCHSFCAECFTETACISTDASCTWERGEACVALPTTEPATTDPATTGYNMIPMGDVTMDNECICTEEFYTYEADSCQCNDGMKTIFVQYMGLEPRHTLTFFYDSATPYQNCVFNTIDPDQVVECTSFPYAKFEDKILMSSTDKNGANCIASINSTCDIDILDSVPDGDCYEFRVIGWIDFEGNRCVGEALGSYLRRQETDEPTTTQTTTDGGRRRLYGFGDGSVLKAGQRYSSYRGQTYKRHVAHQDMDIDRRRRRRLGSKEKKAKKAKKEKKEKKKKKKKSKDGWKKPKKSKPWKKTPDEYEIVTTEEPTTTEALPTVPAELGSLFDQFCDCASRDSYDDTHYLDANGNVVEVLTNDAANQQPVVNPPADGGGATVREFSVVGYNALYGNGSEPMGIKYLYHIVLAVASVSFLFLL